MDRIIKFTDLEAAVTEAYEKFKSEKDGEVDPRAKGSDPSDFGISVVLTDGSTIVKGDAQKPFVLGAIAKIPTATLLLSQLNSPEKLVEKSGMSDCCRAQKGKKPAIPLSARGIRAVSAIEPTGDPDGKWDLMINNMIDMMGSAPEFSDDLYKAQVEENKKAQVEDVLTKDGFYLYDAAPIAIDLYTKLMAMKATPVQTATMAATIAADGFNPVTKQNVFDGSLSQRVVGAMASHGVHKMNRAWLIRTGLPAKSGFGGGIMGVFPGVMGICAYSPRLNEEGVSVKAAQSLDYIMNKLGISVFGSANVKIEK